MARHEAVPVRAALVTRPRGFGEILHQQLSARSTVAVLMCAPLIFIIGSLVVYPFFFSIYLSMLNKDETEFIFLGNFLWLMSRSTFWMVVQQSVVFALVAVFFKCLIGLIVAHLIHNLPARGQRFWRGMSLVPWVIPPALSTLGWWWLFDPSYSAINWMLTGMGARAIPWLSDVFWARFSVILVNVWYGAPFFMIMYLAALKSIPQELYDAAKVDGATAWQRLIYVTLPMMRNIIAITVLFSTIVTFANFDIVRVLTQGGPRNSTHLFATYAFRLGIESGDVPQGAAVSLFMFPMLAILAFFILRNVRKRSERV
jgi:multiple sugar transport system permease protein